MSDDELRQAAGRRHRVEAGEPAEAVYRDFDGPMLQQLADQLRCGKAYLAEHPADDGEPVTEEWVRSFATNPGLLFEFGDGCSVWFVFNETEGYMDIADGVNAHAELAIPPTRGAVRRLLAALGV